MDQMDANSKRLKENELEEAKREQDGGPS